MNKIYSIVLGLFLGITSSISCIQESVSFVKQCQETAQAVVKCYTGFCVGLYGLCLGVASYVGIKAPSYLNREENCKNDITRRFKHTFFSVSQDVLSEMIPVVNRNIRRTLPLLPVPVILKVGYEHYNKKV